MNIFKRKEALSTGARGEAAAKNYLKGVGYQILATNFCNQSGRRIGEIDIIAKEGDEIVFVEVKTRSSETKSFSLPEENITHSKLYKLNKAATFYLNKNHIQNTPYRFDAISIMADSEANSAKLRHIKNIFL